MTHLGLGYVVFVQERVFAAFDVFLVGLEDDLVW